MKPFSIAVIGGGASGLMAAAAAAKEAKRAGIPANVTVYEANGRVGKKILVTGNGRCNLTNETMGPEYYRGATELFRTVYGQFDSAATLAFFEEAGLFTRSDFAGRVYPMSNQASSVLDTLRTVCAERGVKEAVSCKITSLRRQGEGFLLNDSFFADRVILASGGKAAPVHGSDGSGYDLLRGFGVHVTPLYPALTPLNIDNFTKALKGVRAAGKITLKSGGSILAEAAGELQYTDYGLSGIPAMQVSRFAAQKLAEGGDVLAFVDSAPDIPAEALTEKLLVLRKTHPAMTAEAMLSGLMPKRLGTTLISACSLSPAREIGGLHENAMGKIVSAVKKTKYKVRSVRGFADAQVTAGGVAAEEIDAPAMELKKEKGLYVCGEIADVDGDCGGYNLQWAFSSGAAAGESAARSLTNV
jgi:hypothetical protein